MDQQLDQTKVDVLALTARAAREGVQLSADVAEYIVARMPSATPRELEGALIRVIAYASLTNATLDLSLAMDVLDHIGGKVH